MVTLCESGMTSHRRDRRHAHAHCRHARASSWLLADRPVPDLDFGHRKMLWIACRERHTGTGGSSGYEAVGLAEGQALAGEMAAPAPCAFCLFTPDRGETQRTEETTYRLLLLWEGAAHDLLDVDGTGPWNVADLAQFSDPFGRRLTAQRVYQDGAVKQERHVKRLGFSSADT